MDTYSFKLTEEESSYLYSINLGIIDPKETENYILKYYKENDKDE